MKTHIQCGGGTLCNSNSFTALMNVNDCKQCDKRMEEMLTLVCDAADGKDVAKKAQQLLNRLGFDRVHDGTIGSK